MSSRSLAIIPMKGFARSKSRLSAALATGPRQALATRMFEHVLSVTQRCPSLSQTLVATDDEGVAILAGARGARVIRDEPSASGSLARVIDAGLQHAIALGVDVAVVLMGDLPHIHDADLSALLAELAEVDLVLAPDGTGKCTNALAVRTRAVFPTHFGDPSSFQKHQEHARALGLRTRVLHNPRLAWDVDTLSDLPLAARTWTPGHEPE